MKEELSNISQEDEAVVIRYLLDILRTHDIITEEEEQLNAIEKQIEENRDVINTKGWMLVDEYIDKGITGTQTKKRNEYMRMLDDIRKDKFDIIVVKD